MPNVEQRLLDEINKIGSFSASYTSREKARRFYSPLDLPAKLQAYIDKRQGSLTAKAKALGLTPGTLKRILSGQDITENMLFRLRNSLEQATSVQRKRSKSRTEVFPGDWRNTNTAEIQASVAEVTTRLIFLKNVVVRSNRLKSSDSPIDSIQVAQLIAMLEATLAALKAPFVEKQQTTGFFGFLKKVGKRVLEKKVENALSSAVDQAVDAGSDLLKKLGDAPGTPDIGGLITWLVTREPPRYVERFRIS